MGKPTGRIKGPTHSAKMIESNNRCRCGYGLTKMTAVVIAANLTVRRNSLAV
ncbi:MAG: hypothetical protein ABFS02_14845 [Pseudomonadota bacterium]